VGFCDTNTPPTKEGCWLIYHSAKQGLLMFKKTHIAALITITALLTGCASSGNNVLSNQTGASVASKMQNGVTTEAQVKKMYGDPENTKYLSNGDTVWIYSYKHLSSDASNFIPIVSIFSSGMHGYKKQLVIEFGKNRRLKNFSMSKSHVATTTGILG
jgi:outer membrane protein assembly factor BamE (lipoprotein component of BamABCDE complex)